MSESERPVHSPIGASSMHRWAECPGSIKLSEGIPNVASAYAEEGTRAHAFAAEWLKGNGKMPPVPEDVDEDMVEACKVYVDHIFELATGDGCRLFIEHGFDLQEIYPGAYGTNDAAVYKPSRRTLYVRDFKFGAGVFVEVRNNPQLLYYALGGLLEIQKLGCPVDLVDLGIVQPRCPGTIGPIRSYTIDAVDLIDFAGDLVFYADRTKDPQAPLKSGDHCRFCPAIHICPEVNKTRQDVAKYEFKEAAPYDPQLLKTALDSVPLLEAWIKRVNEFAYAEAEAGRTIPGYKLVDKRANRKWRDETEVALYLGGLGVSEDLIFKPRAVKTPAKLEEALPNHKEVLMKFVTKESSGHALVPESDKRPPAKPKAKEEFSAIEGTVIQLPAADPFA